MKLSILVGFLAVCLMAFAANVNSERVKYYHDGLELKGTEAPEDVTETTDAPETTEPAESTDAPDSHVPDQLTIEEAHRFIDHLMATVAQIVNSLLDALHSGKPHPQPGYPHEGLPNHHESEEGNQVPEHPNEHEGPKEDNDLPGHPNDKHENPDNNHPEHHEEHKDDKPEQNEEPEKNKPHPENHENPNQDKEHPEHHENPEENKPHPEHNEEPKEDKEQPEHHEEPKENNHLPENHEESKEDSRNPEHHEEPEKGNHPAQPLEEPKKNEPAVNVHGPNEQLSIEPRTIFSPFWWLVKSGMKTLRGINCSIKGVVNVRHNTEEMLHNFQRCEAGTVKQVQAVVDSAYKVLAISAEIIHINDEDCGNPNYMADNVDPKAKASASCAKKLRSKIISLNSQIKTTVKLIKKVPQDAGVCVHNTFGQYRDSIADFPGFVKECSKLK
ncbi:TPR-containing protein DDB_G0280363 [Musca domestica]|uniref:TPR-containing protein DDB_G0280363 n=1 Tax=Musca domestica TaxID=7370 RepID=A0A9J7D1Z5_MUSDO|nr:TPR-containing protein DDB_G0280363 [Musca domestica]